MKIRILVIFLLALSISCTKTTETQESTATGTDELVIAFGSCAHSYDTLNIMNAVVINPYLAMLPEIAKGSLERTRYQQFRTLFTFLGMVLAAILWPILGEELGAPIIAFLMILTALTMVLGSKEDENVEVSLFAYHRVYCSDCCSVCPEL